MKTTKKIYIICPDNKTPSGGVKQIYKLCDFLSKSEFDISIIHEKKGFNINWFPNKVKVVYSPYLFFKIRQTIRKKNKFIKEIFINKFLPEKDAILIFPEIYGPYISNITDNKYIIYNQNCYYTFNNYSFNDNTKQTTYNSQKLIGILTVSNDSLQYLKLAFPKKNIQKITLGIDPIFSFTENKEKIIAFMPRKLKEDINQIYHILKSNPNLKDWKWQEIDDCNENEVAEILKKSAIFLSLNYNEGFGLPPIEAMASGCYVIGYAGNGGNEYFKDDFSCKIHDRNIFDFTNKIEENVIKFNNNPLNLINLGKKASVFIHENYNLKTEEQTSVNAINNLIKNYNETL